MPNPLGYDILGIGSPVLDHIVPTDDAAVAKLPGGKGGMLAIDEPHFNEILASCGKSKRTLAGGSAANTIQGLSYLGHSCALAGVIGNDLAGRTFQHAIEEAGIYPLFFSSPLPTAQSICFVTPDGDRTMRTHLGASVEMHERLLTHNLFDSCALVHLEGYTLLQAEVADHAMAAAKAAGSLVSIDLASYEVVVAHHERLVELISCFADIVIANADEAWELTGLPPKEACASLKELCKTAVVLFGAGGCWVGQGSKLIHGPAFAAHPVDTTGAGDLFTAGFLHGYLNKCPLEECARRGALAGSTVIQHYGATIPPEDWASLIKEMS